MRLLPIFLTMLALMSELALATPAQDQPALLYGKVVSVDAAASQVVIVPKEGALITVTNDANTKVMVSGKTATLGDVKPGMMLRISPATGTAVDLRAIPQQTTKPPLTKPSILHGKVISVDTATGTVVIAPKDGPQVTITTDASTKILVSGKTVKLADVLPDMTIRVSPATGIAVDLRAFPALPAK